MFQLEDMIDLQTLYESTELEFKLAQGRDGKGKLPDDFWPTYSAMANTRGGYIVLGVKEQHSQFHVEGLTHIEKIKQELFNGLNNSQKVSVNLLTDQQVKQAVLKGKTILLIEIPAARRRQKPVYLKNQPLNETYLRLYDGDRHCSVEQVKRMMAEQIEDSRDSKVLANFDMNDINMDSLHAYRQLLSSAKPNHPALELDMGDFFRSIGGWRKDRETGQDGITLAGILMFGQWEAIRDAAPHYFVDYQERPEAKTERRWIDRICPDGTWSGNVFDFYRRTYRKLIAELKVPFELKNGLRQDETQIHTALREALVNALVHADYSGRLSILIVKRPDLFGFRNPGLMRIPTEQAIKGYDSDCRNRLMHQMFLMIGAGERSGSGVPKIYHGWKSANWRMPRLYEVYEPEQTLLELSIGSLVSTETEQLLRHKFGSTMENLSELERNIIITAATDGWINHARACQLTTLHSRDVTLALPKLVEKGFLTPHGEKREKCYTLLGTPLLSPEDVFLQNPLTHTRVGSENVEMITDNGEMITDNGEMITDNGEMITDNGGDGKYEQMKHRDRFGRFVTDKLPYPFIDDFAKLDQRLQERLLHIAQPARAKKRLANNRMDDIILALCAEHFLPISVIAMLVNRTAQNVREKQLVPLVNQGKMQMAFPHTKRHKMQGYITLNKAS